MLDSKTAIQNWEKAFKSVNKLADEADTNVLVKLNDNQIILTNSFLKRHNIDIGRNATTCYGDKEYYFENIPDEYKWLNEGTIVKFVKDIDESLKTVAKLL